MICVPTGVSIDKHFQLSQAQNVAPYNIPMLTFVNSLRMGRLHSFANVFSFTVFATKMKLLYRVPSNRLISQLRLTSYVAFVQQSGHSGHVLFLTGA